LYGIAQPGDGLAFPDVMGVARPSGLRSFSNLYGKRACNKRIDLVR